MRVFLCRSESCNHSEWLIFPVVIRGSNCLIVGSNSLLGGDQVVLAVLKHYCIRGVVA